MSPASNSSPPASDSFEREVRFAVVMYGGVSLCVYITGVAQELFALVHATAPEASDALTGRFRHPPETLRGTERVYRELATRLRSRFVVDVLSGTSAGGINALFLAKALVRNRSLSGLRGLWLEEADVEKLLNDSGSLEGLPADLLDVPIESVLNGQRFYRRLLDALVEMDRTAAVPSSDAAAAERSHYVDELDLFLTATDFHGLRLEVPLTDPPIEEPHHRKRFHFRYQADSVDGGPENAFERDTNPMLAFAARCSASFPVAFPPFKLADIDTILETHPAYRQDLESRSSSLRWRPFFSEYPDDYGNRYFVDGGYLDNKPFEAAVEAMASRHRAVMPVDRKLLYVEPHPKEPDAVESQQRPDVVATLTAVSSLPRVETIRAELVELNRRNHLLARAAILTEGLEEDARNHEKRQVQGNAALWGRSDLKDMVDAYGVAYGGYHRLKVARLTDWLAERLSPRQGSRERSSSGSMRQLLGAYRDANYIRYYTEEQRTIWKAFQQEIANLSSGEQAQRAEELDLPATENRYLIDFDLTYRLRRIEFERFKVSEMLRSPESARTVLNLARRSDEEVTRWLDDWAEARRALLWLQKELRFVADQLEEVHETCRDGLLEPERKELQQLALRFEDTPEQERATLIEQTQPYLEKIAEHLKDRFIEIGRYHEALFRSPKVPGIGNAAAFYRPIAHFHYHFAELDLVRFSILYTLGTEELDPIEVVRISAADTTLAGSRGVSKLAGVQLGHFGAFLDPGWRKNDILWGRLDAAERLITTLAPADTEEEVAQREQWLVDAFKEIVREELAPYTAEGRHIDHIAEQLAKTLATPKKKRPADLERVAREAARLVEDREWIAIDTEPQSRVALRKLQTYLDRPIAPLAPERALQLIGRSTMVLRELLRGLATKHHQQGNLAVTWLLRLLQTIWLVVQLTIPGLKRQWLRHGLALVFLCGVLIGGLGVFTERVDEMGIGAALAGSTLLLLVLSSALDALATRRLHRWGMIAAGIASLAGGAAVFLLQSRVRFPGALCGVGCTPKDYTMTDVQLAGSAERLRHIVEVLHVQGRFDALLQSILWDFPFLLAYVVLLAGTAWLARGWLTACGRWRWARLCRTAFALAFAAGLCDALENGLLWWQLSDRFPEGGLLPDAAAALTFAVACTKFSLVFFIGLVVAPGLVIGLLGWLRELGKQQTSSSLLTASTDTPADRVRRA